MLNLNKYNNTILYERTFIGDKIYGDKYFRQEKQKSSKLEKQEQLNLIYLRLKMM